MKNIVTFLLIAGLVVTTRIESNAQCFDNGHSPFQDQGWVSCNKSLSLIPERGEAHWLFYDFGHIYALDSMYFWNHNVWGETGMGLKSVLIDFSTDKENWTTIGPIEIEKAPGSWKYTGTNGPVFENVQARYALITVLSTWEEETGCAGLGEVKFSISELISTTQEVAQLNWNVSPNPASDRIIIDLPENADVKTISIYNNVGQLIDQIYQVQNASLVYPVTELKEGIYFITIATTKEMYTKSFVKGG